ncbi:hypothetical protein [Haloarchaeobius amylolyticus]|uniref:hypothetical protein n=1 Tax=Haloarchaeobius amylolyticus TaxID=1198296 RepID=UPI0022718D9D|nr:hypothetical protein [Haloarchaeobius amylolyticus]
MQSRRSQLTRRKVLAGLGTIGVASAGAGLGTTAFYSDREALEGWFEAGRVDNVLSFRSVYEAWERYDLQEVPLADRPPIVPGGNDMQYLLAEAPAFRDATDEPLSFASWRDDIRTIDACSLTDLTDIGISIDSIEGLTAVGVDQVPNDLFLPGLVDGAEGIFLELDDVKPKDLGALQFDIHVCGNPSLAFLSLAVDELTQEGVAENVENGVFESEEEAGETLDANFDTAGFDILSGTELAGELGPYLYAVLLKSDGVYQSFDVVFDKVVAAADDMDDDVLYAGSLTGLVETLVDAGTPGVQLEPSGNAVATEALCFDLDVHSYQLSWFLACAETDPQGLGFEDLLLVNRFTENTFVVEGGVTVDDNDGDAKLTLNDELRQRGFYQAGDIETGITVDVNVTQTDSVRVGFEFTLEQCRANL